MLGSFQVTVGAHADVVFYVPMATDGTLHLAASLDAADMKSGLLGLDRNAEFLTCGGMGDIYTANDQPNIAKILKVRQICASAEVHTLTDHPNIAQVYNDFSINGMFYDKEYLTYPKGDTIVKLLEPSGIDTEGWTDGKVNEAPGEGSMSESSNSGVCGETGLLLSEHELAQERLYRLWRAGWVRGEDVLLWAQSLERLSLEGDCDYLVWLLQRFPRLCENEEHGTSEGSVRKL